MITKAQGYKIEKEASLAARSKLSVMERGMLTWAMLDSGDKILDMNLRDGLMLEYLARNMECEICGISNDMEGVKYARARLQNADILYASPEDIPWREDSFHAVFLYGWKMDEDEWEKVLKETFRVMRPGGQLLLGAAHYPAPFRQVAHLFSREGTEMVDRPSQKGNWMKALKAVGYDQVTWQQLGFGNGIAIGWKPLKLDCEKEESKTA